jgi:hypothetical protein
MGPDPQGILNGRPRPPTARDPLMETPAPDQQEFAIPDLEAEPPTVECLPGADEVERLKVQNAELRAYADELEQQLVQVNKNVRFLTDQQKDLEGLLEEKSSIIRELHVKVQEFYTRPSAASPREDELLALSEELEQERRQLKEDEEVLMQQMRQMEVQMSKERAELARQRNELQRLHSEIQHELELAGREAELRDRLQPLQRRHQEMMHRKGTAPPKPNAPAPPPAAPQEQQPRAKDSGLFRRLFG